MLYETGEDGHTHGRRRSLVRSNRVGNLQDDPLKKGDEKSDLPSFTDNFNGRRAFCIAVRRAGKLSRYMAKLIRTPQSIALEYSC